MHRRAVGRGGWDDALYPHPAGTLGPAGEAGETGRSWIGATDDDADLAWEALAKAALPLAEKLVRAKKPKEEVCLARLAARVYRLKVPADTESLPLKRSLVVAQFKLEPGRGFPWHDHRDYNGLILCVAGEA